MCMLCVLCVCVCWRHRSKKWLLLVATSLPGCYASTSAQGAVLRRLCLFAGKFVHLTQGCRTLCRLWGMVGSRKFGIILGIIWDNMEYYGIIWDNMG